MFAYVQALVHVSTAFNNLDQDEIREEIYNGTTDPQIVIDMIDGLDEELIRNITTQ